MAEIEAGYGRGREHREILGQRDLGWIAAEHVEQHWLEAVVRAGRIAGRGPDSVEFLADQIGGREMLVGIAPEAVADGRVEHLGEALREPVGKRLQEDVVIIVDRLL